MHGRAGGALLKPAAKDVTALTHRLCGIGSIGLVAAPFIGDGSTDRMQTPSDLRRPSQHSAFRRAFGTGRGPEVPDAACGIPAVIEAAVLQTAPLHGPYDWTANQAA